MASVLFGLVLFQVMAVIQGSVLKVYTSLPSPFILDSFTDVAATDTPVSATPDDLIQFTLEAISLPSESRESAQIFPQVDIIQPMKVALLIFTSGSELPLPEGSYFQGKYSIRSDVVGDVQQLSDVPTHLCTVSKFENNEKGLCFCAGIHLCARSSMMREQVRVTAELKKIKSDTPQLSENESLDIKQDVMMLELAQLRVLLAQIKETEASIFMDQYPDLIMVSLTSLSTDDSTVVNHPLVHAMHQTLHDIVNQVNELAQNMVLMEMMIMSDDEQVMIAEDDKSMDTMAARIMRKLQQANGTILVTNDTSDATNLKSPSLRDIEEYQIILWTSISLFVVLLSTVCCLCNMPIGRDSLLYAKFQTDGSHRKMH